VVLQRRREQRQHVICEESQIGEARRDAQRMALTYGLDATQAARVALAASELATNLLRHAGGGELLLQPLTAEDDSEVVELLAIDRGRGMQDVERCMRDGFSTAGTAGTGLGAVRRLSVEFDIHSVAGEGTVVLARVGARPVARFGAVSVALKGESACGDSWALARNDECTAVMVIDGLGHGTFAALAAESAQRGFCEAPFDMPREALQRTHRDLVATRGAAVAVSRETADGRLAYAGVGNITAYLVGEGRSQGLISHNGTLGVQMPRLQQFEYTRQQDTLLVMHSDGLSARWNLKGNSALRARHPAVVAAVLYRDHARAHDDATVVVVN
jgi:anti-sigma regulatory factor (Ser/Thr protein kinase)